MINNLINSISRFLARRDYFNQKSFIIDSGADSQKSKIKFRDFLEIRKKQINRWFKRFGLTS